MTTVLTADQTADRIGAAQLLPVLRTKTAEEADLFARRLLSLGLGALELTATTPDWTDLVSDLRSSVPEALIGVGTIGSAAEAEQALGAGAQFLVSPFPVPEVRSVAAAAGTLLIEGGLTPGELASATSRGAAKLFPAHVGGLTYLKSMLAVLPGTRIIPTGGIPVSDVHLWLEAGAFAVGVGSDLYTGGDVDAKVNALLARLRQGVL